jgi:hypothetical protein
MLWEKNSRIPSRIHGNIRLGQNSNVMPKFGRNPANKQGDIYRLALLASHIVFSTA